MIFTVCIRTDLHKAVQEQDVKKVQELLLRLDLVEINK